jgi:hypothetical protein
MVVMAIPSLFYETNESAIKMNTILNCCWLIVACHWFVGSAEFKCDDCFLIETVAKLMIN